MPLTQQPPEDSSMDADRRVRRFLEGLASPHHGLDELLINELDSECIWEIVGLFRAIGPVDSAAQFTRRGWSGIKCSITRTLPAGDSVLVEGVRTFLNAQGAEGIQIPFMSVVTAISGRIVAWRDYLDTTSLRVGLKTNNGVAV